jgi:hypothetical protein
MDRLPSALEAHVLIFYSVPPSAFGAHDEGVRLTV